MKIRDVSVENFIKYIEGYYIEEKQSKNLEEMLGFLYEVEYKANEHMEYTVNLFEDRERGKLFYKFNFDIDTSYGKMSPIAFIEREIQEFIRTPQKKEELKVKEVNQGKMEVERSPFILQKNAKEEKLARKLKQEYFTGKTISTTAEESTAAITTVTEITPLRANRVDFLKNPIVKAANFHFLKPYPLNVSNLISKAFFISLVSACSVLLYYRPSIDAAGTNKKYQVLYPLSSISSNFILNVWVAYSLLESISNLKTPHELKEHMPKNTDTWKGLLKRYGLRIFLAIAISSLGAVLPTLVYLQQNSDQEIVKRIIFAILNALGDWILSAYTVLKIGESITNLSRRRNSVYQTKMLITHNLDFGMSYLARREKRYPNAILMNDYPNEIIEKVGLGTAKLVHVMQYNNASHLFSSSAQKNSKSRKILKYTARPFLGIVGASLLCVGWLGQTLDAEKQIYGWTHNKASSWSGAVVGSTFYYLASLYIGYTVFTTLYDVIEKLIAREPVGSFPFQRYPRSAMLLNLIGIMCSLFSYAAAVQLLKENYHWDGLEVLIWITMIGTVFFNAFGFPYLINGILPLLARIGSSEERLFYQLNAQAESFANSVSQMNDDDFKKGIEALPEPIPENLLQRSKGEVKCLINGYSVGDLPQTFLAKTTQMEATAKPGPIPLVKEEIEKDRATQQKDRSTFNRWH